MNAQVIYRFAGRESTAFDAAREYFCEVEQKLMDKERQEQGVGEVEQTLYTEMLELGRRLLQAHIDGRGAGCVGEALERQDGTVLSHKRPGLRHLESLFGEVEVERLGYSQRHEATIFPKDRQLQLPDMLYSYPVQQKVCREAIRASYNEARETVSEYTGARVPKRQALTIVQHASEDFEAFYASRARLAAQPLEEGMILVHSADGKGVPMREEGLREATRKRAKARKASRGRSNDKRRDRKREALVASVYTIAPQRRTIDDVMAAFWGKQTNSAPSPRPQRKRVWASLIKEKGEVFGEMAQEGQRRLAGSTTAVFLSDGATILQTLAEKKLKPHFDAPSIGFVMILDLMHVLAYLWKAAVAFYPNKNRQTEEWVGKYLRRILEGKASHVARSIRRLATLRHLQGAQREAVDKAATYFVNNQAYMQYATYLELGLPIASGAIEGACKHLVKDRFEISGARWGLPGAEALLKLRAIYQSGDWQDYWTFHIACEQERLHPQQQWQSVPMAQTPPTLRVLQGGKASKK